MSIPARMFRVRVHDHVRVKPDGANGRLLDGKPHPQAGRRGTVTEIRTMFVPAPVAHIKLDDGSGVIFVSLEFLEVE